MSMQDSISDMLTRIRNAYMVSLDEILMPSNKMKLGILNIFKKKGYITNYFEEDRENNKKYVKVILKYKDGKSVIRGIKRISKPSCRIYCNNKKIPRVLNGFGVATISTNMGIMCGRDAYKNNIGGEIICYIW